MSKFFIVYFSLILIFLTTIFIYLRILKKSYKDSRFVKIYQWLIVITGSLFLFSNGPDDLAEYFIRVLENKENRLLENLVDYFAYFLGHLIGLILVPLILTFIVRTPLLLFKKSNK
ncbi:MAG: hypothetical protein CMQ54_02065 [Gammaproteobacteria bacterium]|nr:hypothetical protein [Gammaproteobacteria bacterium]|tara:strand:+ start:305 stop:652 length:348 start_codon:yes stop_codon:yes gene_type:complete